MGEIGGTDTALYSCLPADPNPLSLYQALHIHWPLHFSEIFPSWFLGSISENLAGGFVWCAILLLIRIPVIPLGEKMKKLPYSCIS